MRLFNSLSMRTRDSLNRITNNSKAITTLNNNSTTPEDTSLKTDLGKCVLCTFGTELYFLTFIHCCSSATPFLINHDASSDSRVVTTNLHGSLVVRASFQ